MRLIALLLVCVMAIPVAVAQDGSNAGRVLENFAKKNKSYDNFFFEFDFTLDNRQANTVDTRSGEIYIQKEKYKLILPGLSMERLFDGEAIWNYMPEVMEVTVSDPNGDSDGSFMSNPQKLFDSYMEDYKYKYIKSFSEAGKTYHEIDLYPKDLQKASFSRVKLAIEYHSYTLKSAQIFSKDGNIYTFTIKGFKSNMSLSENFFKFDDKNGEVEVIDMRY